jgi:glycosyltransferase involved in cell wall biosynthesis
MASKVTIITPIYNGERFIDQYISSLLQQTYNNVELIIVNDGSTDRTLDLCEKKKVLLEQKGWKIQILSQANKGAASAVNTALKKVSGDYIMLFDVDDILMPDNISSKALFLDMHPEYGMVRNNGYMVFEDDLNNTNIPLVKNDKEKQNEWIFDDLVYAYTNNWPGTFMVRFSFFHSLHPDLEIYTSQYGQNLQLMLSVAWFYKTGFIDSYLTKYIIYKRSHSHSDNPMRLHELQIGYIQNRIGIIEKMNIPKKKKTFYLNYLQKKILRENINWQLHLKNRKKEIILSIKDCLAAGYLPIRTVLKAIWYVLG